MRLLSIFPVLGIIAAACSSPQATTDGGGTDSGPSDAKKESGPPVEAGPTCEQLMTCLDSEKPGSANPQCIMSMTVKLVDDKGAPAAGEYVYMCGTNICPVPPKTDAQGMVTFSNLCQWFDNAALKYLGEHRYVSYASAVTQMTKNVVYANPVTIFPLPQAGVAFPGMAGGPITSNNVILTLQANTTIKYDPSESMDPENQKFRAVEVPLTKAPPDTDAALKLEVLWGLAPVNCAIAPSAQLTVPNVKAWAPNAAVEVFLNGVDTFDLKPPAPYGKFGPIGLAHVSGNGMTVVTDPGTGNGIPMLGIVGMRLK